MSAEEAITTRVGRFEKLLDVKVAVLITILELVLGIVYSYIVAAYRLPSVFAALALGYTFAGFVALCSWVYSIKILPRKLAGKSPEEIWGFLGEVFSTLYHLHRGRKLWIFFAVMFLIVLPVVTALFYPRFTALCSGFLTLAVAFTVIFLLGVFIMYGRVLTFFTIIHKMYEILQLSIAIMTLELAIFEHYTNVAVLAILMIILSAISLIAAFMRHKLLIESTVPTTV